MAHPACLVCLISTVSGCSKKKKKCGASSGHITDLKQSIFAFDIYDYNLATTEARVKKHRFEIRLILEMF